MISVRNLVKAFPTPGGQVRALDGVSLEIPDGQIYGVVGQSGAGKSTLIRSVNLLERPTSGSILIDGTDVTRLHGAELRAMRNRIGMVFQHFNLLSSRTARRNVELPLEVAGVPAAKRRSRALEILDLVGLADKADAYPAQLSGGQKQRVGIARALAGDPRVLLSDEATSALDPETTTSILELIQRINRELGVTVLLITHEMDVVKRICDSAALMEHGRIVEQGPISQLITTPGSRIASALFPLGDATGSHGRPVVDITFTGADSHDPVISHLVRTYDIDVSILGAAIESIGTTQAGRLRVELDGDPGRIEAALASLAEQGLFIEHVGGANRA